MNTSPLVEYFAAEKQAAALLLALAVCAVCLGLYLRVAEHPFRSMAWVLFAVAALQIAVGAGLLVRTAPQVAALHRGFATAPAQTLEAEKNRMTKVNRNWVPIKVVEAALLLIGLCLIFGVKGHVDLQGIGMGLLLESASMLVFDVFAERRAWAYTQWLASLPLN